MSVDLDNVRALLIEDRSQGLQKNVGLAIRLANEVPGLLAEVETMRGCLKMLLRSATPKASEHPTMWDAWGDAAILIGRDRNSFRVPHSDMPGGERALSALRSGRTL